MRISKYIIVGLCIAATLSCEVKVRADDYEVEKEEEVYSTVIDNTKYDYVLNQYIYADTENITVEYPEEVEKNGRKYKLEDVKYQVIKENKTVGDAYINGEEGLTKEQMESYTPEKTITEDGKTYELIDVQYEKCPSKEKIEAYVDSDYVCDKPTPDEYMDFQYTSPKTKDTSVYKLKYNHMELIEEYSWKEFSMPMIVTDVDAEVYEIGGEIVYLDDNNISLSDKDILAIYNETNLDKSNFKIDNLKWSGDTYCEDGKTLRNAEISGKYYVAKYRMYYEADNQDTGETYTLILTYEDNSDVCNYKYTILVTACYKNNANVAWLVCIIMAALATVLIMVLAVNFKKKKDKEKKDPLIKEAKKIVNGK